MHIRKLGQSGEAWAVDFLKQQGYRICETNFRVKAGEIDIIALDGDTLCFIEVKTRAGDSHGSGFDAISGFKRRKLTQTALWYIAKKRLGDVNARFDVVAITISESNAPRFDLLKNAFEAVGDC